MPERYLPAPANILLVDDRKENLAVLKHYLKSPQVRLVTAASGQQALREVLHQDFALILLDVVMPDMTGFEVANHLKAVERTRHIPIIFLTAYAADVAQIFEAYSVGAVDYLVKPVDRVVVRKKVEVFVDLHRQRRELLYQEAQLRAAERREHELVVAELRVASDRRYRALVQGIEHAIAWTAEPAGDGWRLTFVSDQAERLLQYQPEQLARPGFLVEQVHPEDRALWLETLEGARTRHSDESCVHRFIAADGREVWFRTVVSGHVADPGHPAEVHGLSLDVTELKRGELTQRFLADAAAVLSEPRDFHAALEELARFVVPDLADGCVVEVVHEEALEQLTVVHVDPAAEARAREVGVARAPPSTGGAGEVLRTGRTVLHAGPPPEPGLPPAPLGPAYARVLRALNAHSFISLPLRPRGELRAVITLVASSPARRFGPAVVALAEDLVTRSGLIVDNARLYDEARRATRARDELLAVVSHDLKNPLSAIALGARRIETLDPALPSSQTLLSARTAASRIHRAASRMERLLNDLLDMERIQTQRLRLEPQPQDAADLMNEAGELLAPVAATRSISLQLENEAPRSLRIPADTERLLQVFWNLVGNAIKFTPEGGTIVLRLQAEDSWARFTVTDSGPGLRGDQLQRVFEPRWQAEGEGARQGLGLGLAIAKGIVEAHGGRIWAENAPGHGACFGILLPTVAGEDSRVETTH